MKKFLAVTSLVEGIDLNAESILYIENVCLKNRELRKSDLLLKKSYSGINDIRRFSLEIDKTKRIIIALLTKKMNEIHQVNYSVRSWDRILFYWLDYYLETMFLKYNNVYLAQKKYKLYAYALDKRDYKHPFFRSGFFSWTQKREDYNFQLYTHVLEYMKVPIEKYVRLKEKTVNSMQKSSGAIRLHKDNDNLYTAETLIINPEQYGFTEYEKNFLKVESRSRIGFLSLDEIDTPTYEYNESLRKKIQFDIINSYSDFEKMILKYLFLDIPTIYLEGFERLNSLVKHINPKNVISAQDHNAWEKISFIIGKNNCKLFTIQIGGDANVWWGRDEAYLESCFSDVLYTSGWINKEYSCLMKKLTNPRYAKAISDKNNSIEKKYDILYVGGVVFTYQFIISLMISLYAKEYQEKRVNFIKQLLKIKNIKTKIRPFELDEEWINSITKWNNVIIDNHNLRFTKEVQKTRLCIVDFIGTPWAEAFVLNIPTIIIIEESMMNFKSEELEVIILLKKAGILFSSYEEALTFIINNYQEIEKWWNDFFRQNIINDIKNKYIWCATDYKQEWMYEFLTIANGIYEE